MRSLLSGSGERIQKPLGPLAVTRPATLTTPEWKKLALSSTAGWAYLDTSAIQRRQVSVSGDLRDSCNRGCRTRRGICQPQRSEEGLEERHGAVSTLLMLWSNFMLEMLKTLYVAMQPHSTPVAETFHISSRTVDVDKTIHRISPGTWALRCRGLSLNAEVVKRLLYLARRARARCIPLPAGTDDQEEMVLPIPPSIGGFLHSRDLRRLSLAIQPWRCD